MLLFTRWEKKKKDLKTKDGSKPTLREHLVCSLLSIALACTTHERIPFYIYIYRERKRESISVSGKERNLTQWVLGGWWGYWFKIYKYMSNSLIKMEPQNVIRSNWKIQHFIMGHGVQTRKYAKVKGCNTQYM